MIIENPSEGVTVVKIPFQRVEGWQHWALITSDRHWDNPDSKWKLQRRHLDEALKRNATIIDCGDLFCAMQGKFDKRAVKGKLRSIHDGPKYFNLLQDTAIEWFKPYAKNFAMIGTGNHETAILKNHEVDLTDGLVRGLNRETGSSIIHGGYTGYVRFKFADGNHIQSKIIHYDHGHGGGGPATKGVIQAHRRDAYIDNVDIICSGHVHESYSVETVRKYLSGNDKIKFKTTVHLCIPTYKEEYKTGRGGYHVEKGRPPKPLGAWWVRFYYEAFSGRIKFDYTRAN